MKMMRIGMMALAAALGAIACSETTDDQEKNLLADGFALPVRPTSVIADTCILDSWQMSTLAAPATQRVLNHGDVILLCLIPREDGTVGPRDPSALAAITEQTAQLHGYGYHVRLGVSFTDETGVRFDGAQTTAWLNDPKWQAQFLATIGVAADAADGFELDMENLSPTARENVSQLVTSLSHQIRPAKTLGIFLPPSVTIPDDIQAGAAFDRAYLATLVDRMRVMTLDYSVGTPGPTIDPGWAVDATRLALASSANVDVSYPLYGTDFNAHGPRLTSYDEAIASAQEYDVVVQHGPTGAPHIDFDDFGGEMHHLWFDDATSTTDALAAWSTALPPNVGLTFYGLGDEDPALWDTLAARLP